MKITDVKAGGTYAVAPHVERGADVPRRWYEAEVIEVLPLGQAHTKYGTTPDAPVPSNPRMEPRLRQVAGEHGNHDTKVAVVRLTSLWSRKAWSKGVFDQLPVRAPETGLCWTTGRYIVGPVDDLRSKTLAISEACQKHEEAMDLREQRVNAIVEALPEDIKARVSFAQDRKPFLLVDMDETTFNVLADLLDEAGVLVDRPTA